MTDRPSVVMSSAVRVVSPLATMLAAFLFFAGHNQPGGGFAAGLVAGSIVALRALAGLPSSLNAVTLMALGGAIAGVVGLAPLVVGDPLLDQAVWETSVPVLGTIKAGSALAFDVGVAAIVVGLVVAALDGLGATSGEPAEIDRGGSVENGVVR